MGSGMLNQLAGMGFLALAGFFYVITLYHISLILIGLRLTRGKKAPFHKGSLRNPVDLPTVSIIVPAKDEEVVIEGAIKCADALDYPRDLLEIIVVEDGSTDETPGIAQRMRPQVENLVALTGGESKGKPAALNRALNVAKGEVIAIFDCDTRYAPDLLLRMAKFFHDHSEAEIAQAIPRVADADRNVITRLNAYEMRFWYQASTLLRRSTASSSTWPALGCSSNGRCSTALASGMRVASLRIWISPVGTRRREEGRSSWMPRCGFSQPTRRATCFVSASDGGQGPCRCCGST